MKTTRTGFTLIELLVVIAIIAILAAILFPVFISAKAKARDAQCASNMKQIGIATALYMQDSSGRFPPWFSTATEAQAFSDGGTLLYLLKSYTRTKLLARCPSDEAKAGGPMVSSLQTNGYLNYWAPRGARKAPTENSVRCTKTTCFIQDALPFDNWMQNLWSPSKYYLGEAGYYSYGTAEKWHAAAVKAETRHGGGSNVLFCDWHVRNVKPDEWQTSRTTPDPHDNPITRNTGYSVPSPWDRHNDGMHPWYRPD